MPHTLVYDLLILVPAFLLITIEVNKNKKLLWLVVATYLGVLLLPLIGYFNKIALPALIPIIFFIYFIQQLKQVSKQDNRQKNLWAWAWKVTNWTGQATGVDQGSESQSGRFVWRKRCCRQRRNNQTYYNEAKSTYLQSRRPGSTNGERKHAMVFSEICCAPPCRRRNGTLWPELVQQGWCWAGNEVLYRRGIQRVLEIHAGIWTHADPIRNHPD